MNRQLLGRDEEIKWLERNSRCNSLLVISGLRGIGKTHLLKFWLYEKKLTQKWISFEPYKTLAQALQVREASDEMVLEAASQDWQSKDFVVWDNFHLLAPKTKNIVISFLKSNPFGPKHILVSGEELTEECGIEIPQLILQPFTVEGVERYIQEIIEDSEKINFTELHAKTSGIPLLLNLWIQSPDKTAGFVQGLFQGMSANVVNLYTTICLLGRAVHIKDLSYFTDDAQEIVLGLKKSFLVEVLPSDEQVIIASEYLKNFFVKSLDITEVERITLKIISFLENQNNVEALEMIRHSLMLKNVEQINKNLFKISFDQLENLHQLDLKHLNELFQKNKQAYTSLSDESVRFRRLLMKTCFLLGERQDAMASTAQMAKTIDPKAINLEQEQLILEYVQLLNRALEKESALELANKFLNYMHEPFRTLLRIEQGVSNLGTDFDRAAGIFSTILDNCLRKIETAENKYSLREAAALSAFHLGRTLHHQNEYDLAFEKYNIAYKIYKDLEKPYFTAVCQLNMIWILSADYRWQELESHSQSLCTLAKKYGYSYVLLGLELNSSIQSRLFLQNSKALHHVNACLNLLKQSTPIIAQLDVKIEAIRVYSSLGLRRQAIRLMNEVESIVQSQGITTLDQKIKLNKKELFAFEKSSEDLIEDCPGIGNVSENEGLITILLQRQQNDSQQIELEKLSLQAKGKLAIKESELIASLKNKDNESSWLLVAELESLTQNLLEPCAEKIAILLVQSQLSDVKSEKQQKLDQAEIELQRWGCDPEVKAPLQLWLNNLIRPDYSLLDHPSWKKIAIGDRERWENWISPFHQKCELKYLVIQNEKRTETDEIPKIEKGLFFHEALVDVFMNKKQIPEFIKRHSLRSLLSLLLELFPNEANKETIVATIWGERYNPLVHDARIYTLVQRARKILKQEDCIQNFQNSYRWNPKINFTFVRSNNRRYVAKKRCQNIILQALEQYSENGSPWLSRSDLVKITKGSDATIKRDLAKLLQDSLIIRRGKGRSVAYSKK